MNHDPNENHESDVNPDQNEAAETQVQETPPTTVGGEEVTDDTVVNPDLAPAPLSNEHGDTQPNVPHVNPEISRQEGDDKTSLPSIH